MLRIVRTQIFDEKNTKNPPLFCNLVIWLFAKQISTKFFFAESLLLRAFSIIYPKKNSSIRNILVVIIK